MVSPDRPLPAAVLEEVAENLAMAVGGELTTFGHHECAEFRRQASVVLDTLRYLEPERRAELLADWAQEAPDA